MTLLVAFAACIAIQAQEVQRQRVYIFGFAASLSDSLAYQTDIQVLDSAYLYRNGFLADRTQYSTQLQQAVQQMSGHGNMICSVFFDKKKAKLEKKYLKIKQRYARNHAVVVQPLNSEMFRFKKVEYMQTMEDTNQ